MISFSALGTLSNPYRTPIAPTNSVLKTSAELGIWPKERIGGLASTGQHNRKEDVHCFPKECSHLGSRRWLLWIHNAAVGGIEAD
jgi:hypothetical protein